MNTARTVYMRYMVCVTCTQIPNPNGSVLGAAKDQLGGEQAYYGVRFGKAILLVHHDTELFFDLFRIFSARLPLSFSLFDSPESHLSFSHFGFQQSPIALDNRVLFLLYMPELA